MDYSFIAIMAVVIMACIGIVFGFILASADKKFAMEENPLIGEVKEALPQGQCGACGFAGCAKYAEAVVLDPNVPPNLCVPGKAEVAAVVAKLTGKVAEATEPKYAHIKCRGGNGIAKLAYEYKGIHDCAAAKIVQQGPKFCKFGCLGFGNCTRACPFGAMSMGETVGIFLADSITFSLEPSITISALSHLMLPRTTSSNSCRSVPKSASAVAPKISALRL